jgi:hypothetical protein
LIVIKASTTTVPFLTTEYDRAFGLFIYETTYGLARARSPLLQQIKVLPAAGTASSVVDSRESEQLDLPAQPVGLTLSGDVDAVLSCDVEALTAALDHAADELGRDLVGVLVDTMKKVTESTGNVVQSKGKGFDFESFIEALDKLEWSLDDNDELVMPQLVMHADTAKNLPPEPTPEQQARLDALTQRKREELLARRRTRRLS